MALAIIGSRTFDVAGVDQTTLRLSGAEEIHWDAAGPIRHTTDANRDGIADLVIHVNLADTQGISPGTAGKVFVTGQTFGGEPIFGRTWYTLFRRF